MESEPAHFAPLDRRLLDQSDAMLISLLDGYLTGIVVSPDLVLPGQWLPLIWAGDEGDGAPQFETDEEQRAFLNMVMAHYHAIIASLGQPGAYAPVLESDTRTGEILWEMWVDGYGAVA